MMMEFIKQQVMKLPGDARLASRKIGSEFLSPGQFSHPLAQNVCSVVIFFSAFISMA
jgi:hypothetical protein